MTGRTVQRALIHVGLVSAAFVMVYPLLWLGASSFRPSERALLETGLWIGDDFTLANYTNSWNSVGSTGFGTFFRNSVIIAVLAVIGNIVSCSLAAYAFARIKFRGRRIWFALMIGTIMLPYHVLLIPQYLLFDQLGWLDSFLPLVVPRFLATEAFFVFLLVQFFRLIPHELLEAARLDGCGYLGTFLRIVMPLAVPALATTAAFSFIWTWNDFLNPLIYLTSPENYTVPIGLSLFVDASGTSNYGGLFAMSILSLLPVIGFFLAFQKLLIEGISTTGLK
ncbi:carbohydrate ABC transporter permease [Microlunatus parietis]|uniref:Multiple sugar transport system permease protein n=1 Tax=Microlunatus parietis TaxID=682979 RepID=A0A7Y9IB67_9ACTN|nr:carbohydrate ABC transporter permease [Microlunatus parietis]NYE73477.1 multiple sugar transport system permease protein [Microlunatus parietis]